MDLPLWIRCEVTRVFCQSWLLRGRVWGQGLDCRAEAWDLTFPLCPLSPCSSRPLAIPGTLGQPTEGAVSEAHVPAAVPGTGLPRRERPACLSGPCSRWSRAGDPGEAGWECSHPHVVSSSVSDEVILSFVDSLTEVAFYLPFSLSLCLAFGQTTSNPTTRGNPYS